MKQIRFITHDDNHVDEETLINGIWAVTRCDCELTNAALLPDSKENEIDTWTCSCKEVKTHPMTKATCYRCFDERDEVVARNIVLSQITEEDADALHDFIFAAEIADSKPDVDEYWLDEPVQLSHRPDEFSAADCGTRFIVSGGEVIELDDTLPYHWYHDNPNY